MVIVKPFRELYRLPCDSGNSQVKTLVYRHQMQVQYLPSTISIIGTQVMICARQLDFTLIKATGEAKVT